MSGAESPKGTMTISRKKLGAIVVSVIVVLAGVMIYLYRSSPTTDVKIVKFFYVIEDSHIAEGQMILPFYVKVENQGSNNVSGLVLVVKVFGDERELARDTAPMGTLKAGQRKTMSMLVQVDMTKVIGKTISYVATLYSDQTIIDENTTPSKY